jgi:pimeloyl-ACP methyl ester carboxylesterase
MYKKIINQEGNEFHYYEYGIGNTRTLLFLPGYADIGLMYQKLGRSLSKEYRVLALDFPMVHKPDKIYDLQMLTTHVAKFIDQLSLENFTIAGFSSCGLVAISYAYNHQDKINELILLNSVPRFILSKPNRIFYRTLKPFLLLRPILFIYSRLNTSKLVRKVLKLPPISSYTADRMKNFYYSVMGTAVNLVGESVFARFKKVKAPKKIIFFKDDTIIPWERYQRFVEKLDCEVVVFSEGLHADKKIYWEKLKTLWLKTPKIEYQDVNIEKSK